MGQSLTSVKLEDRYYLQKVKLGQGSFGTVWRGIDRGSGDIVAVKSLDKAAMPRRGVKRSDIEREINVMQAVFGHQNITRLLGFFEDATSIYLALEYCDGGDFGDKVLEKGMKLSEDEAADWMGQILSGIASLHEKNVCHRDIKPDNFMVHQDTLKLTDFGLAVFMQKGRLLTEKCGTPAFMAPEQHLLPRQSRGYSELCDEWAAGITMYMLMFGGQHPFMAGNKLDEKKLIAGSLDFNLGQGFLGFTGLGEGRFSEQARRLCRRLVEPDVNKRLTAEMAKQDGWLQLGKRRPSRQPSISRNVTTPLGQFQETDGVIVPRSRAKTAEPKELNEQAGAPQMEKLKRENEALQQQIKLQQENADSQLDLLREMQAHQNKAPAPGSRPGSRRGSKDSIEAPKPKAEGEAPCIGSVVQGSVDLLKKQQLPVGMKCRYNSSSWQGWMPAVVQSFNESDGTYNLDVRPHARPENISPALVAAAEAWQPGTLVHYESSSVMHWLPAVVKSYNEGKTGQEGSYNLDVRDCAALDRIRPRCFE